MHLDEPLFFANAERITGKMQQAVTSSGVQSLLVHLNGTVYRLLQQIDPPVIPSSSLSGVSLKAVSKVVLNRAEQPAIAAASRPIE